jgi:predicted TPR repeat methyltransferase
MRLNQAAQVHLAEAARFVAANELEKAEAACREFLRLTPKPADQSGARIWQGVIAMRRSDPAVALMHFEAAYPFEKSNAQLVQQIGLAHFRLTNIERAEHFYRAAIRIEPRFAAAHYNLGLALQAKRDLAGAKRAFEHALQHAPTLAVAHTNLANTLFVLGETDAAVQRYEKAVELDPTIAEAHHGLGLALQRKNDLVRAEDQIRLAHALMPDAADIALDLADLLFNKQHQAEAINLVEEVLARDPAHETAQFKLAQYRGTSVDAMPRSLVEKLYAGMANTFDEHLVERLGYRIPELLIAQLKPWVGDKKHRVLDLGCGTGLFGALIRPHAESLIGVDLSADMLTHANARKIYDTLAESDAIQYLDDTDASFDLIVATDVLIYIAPLPPLFSAVAKHLRTGGRFAFSTETPEGLDRDFRLEPTGRYAHSAGYIERLVRDAGMTVVEKISTVIRTEKSVPVKGFVFVVEKS